jgi:hypothetical protein
MSEVILAPWKSIMMARLKSGRITSFRQSLGLERVGWLSGTARPKGWAASTRLPRWPVTFLN